MLIRVNEITSWLTDIFATAGCPYEEARLIAVHLVDADASGHPSHGIVRVPRYIDYIHAGTVRPVCANETLVDSETLCLICLLYTSPSPRDKRQSRMPSSA